MLPTIGLTGYARSGKDTVASHLVKAHGYHRVAFADGVRDMALAIDPIVASFPGGEDRLSHYVQGYGWDGAKEVPEVRRLLQRLGTEGVRQVLGPDQWIDLAMRKAALVVGAPVVFSDVRFPNEAQAIHDIGGSVVRVVRPGHAERMRHHSEVAMDGYAVDGCLYNLNKKQDLEGDASALLSVLSSLLQEIQ